MRDTFIEELSRIATIDPGVLLFNRDLGFGVFEKNLEKNFLNSF